ncbi:amino acid permease, partial [candidate division KSB1 bacterium]
TALTYCELVSVHPESGEGYLYARKTFPAPIAYLVGLTLVLGYSSSCAFYIASFSSYFYEFVWRAPFEVLSGIAALILLIFINIKGTKESGTFQVIITVVKIILLLWFVYGGMSSVNITELKDRFSTDVADIGGTAAMVFITFFGFSAIAASAGEVKNPKKTIPRAIFYSIGIVTILYTFVIIVIIAAGLTEYNEAAMGSAAVKFLGPIGGMVIIAGALFSMISASNASILAGSRVVMSMSRLGHLPSGFGVISTRTHTPIVSLAVVGSAILLFSIGFRLENLAHFADTVLIFALIFVNAALIIHRKKYPNIERPFKVPWVPLLPILGIIANTYLLSQILIHHPEPFIIACICLILGTVAFLIWKSVEPPELLIPGEPSKVALVQPANSESRFRVLVPIANPANVKQLIELASAIASDRDGEVVALRVTIIPEQISPSRENYYIERERQILEQAQATAKKIDVPMTSLVRVGHGRARAILETARERKCDLVVLGWKGYTSTARKILGDVVDSIVSNARSDIMLYKQVDDMIPQNILLPTAGGEHARCAEQYAASLVRLYDGAITVCGVIPPNASEEMMQNVTDRLDQAKERILETHEIDVKSKIIQHSSVSVGIIKESENYDAVALGAAGRSIYPKILFGSIPESIAKHCNKPVFLVKHFDPLKSLFGRVMEE